MACDLFTVSISTVAYESAFSTGRCILDVFRRSLTSKIVEALIYNLNWPRMVNKPIYFEETLENIKNLRKVV